MKDANRDPVDCICLNPSPFEHGWLYCGVVFSVTESSNSSWAEMEPYVIGSYCMYPLNIDMQQRLILQYLTPMGEYQEVRTSHPSDLYSTTSWMFALCYQLFHKTMSEYQEVCTSLPSTLYNTTWMFAICYPLFHKNVVGGSVQNNF